ncbi:MAG: adenosylcobinamide-GDP ribazoletransferase [Eubacterium sp.]|nr:adenosylcobinamide-GDP ribazoletransferase [Eubacterium sp.]
MGVISVIKSIGSAFSMYSRIPMPEAVWKGDPPRYTLGFFPWVGAVIGGAEYLMYRFLPVPVPALVLLMAILPLILTGGIHVDGFMDTADAFHSYGDREKKLEILSDPHIGAFSVIRVLLLAGLYLAGLFCLLDSTRDGALQHEAVICFCLGFPLGRCFSGLLVMLCPPARSKGMAASMKADSSRKGNVVLLALQGTALILWGLILSPMIMTPGVLALIFVIGFFLVERVKPLGGITGDLAGWFLTVSECGMLLGMAGTFLAISF